MCGVEREIKCEKNIVIFIRIVWCINNHGDNRVAAKKRSGAMR